MDPLVGDVRVQGSTVAGNRAGSVACWEIEHACLLNFFSKFSPLGNGANNHKADLTII